MISYRRVQKENDELLCTVRSLVMVRSELPAQVVNLLRWNDVSRTLRIFCLKSASIFSVLSITHVEQIIDLLLPNNFYLSTVISYRRVQKENDELLCTVRLLVMVRNQLPAQVVNSDILSSLLNCYLTTHSIHQSCMSLSVRHRSIAISV